MKNDNHEEDIGDMNSDSVKSNNRKRSSPEVCEVREAAVEVELQPSCVGISETNSQAADSLAEAGSWIKNKSRFRKTMENSFENTQKLPEEIGSSPTDQMNILSTAFIQDVGNSKDSLISLPTVEASSVSVALESNGHAYNRPDKGGSSPKGIDIVSNLVSDVRDGEEKSLSTDAEKTEECSLAIAKKADSGSITLQSSIARPPVSNLRKKLLVLDLNGLLADIVFPPPKDYTADINISGKAVFKRPFCDDFLSFCFERFEVGVWSSRIRKNVDRVIDFLLGDMKQKLLFCWDSSYCTTTQFKTLENQHKPLVFKELRKLWDKHDADLPWEKGFYNESNTLLLDDTPYKALLNPPHTAIFPHSYKFQDENDNSLGSGGDLRVYLEGLAAAEEVQTFVEQNPFGQTPINESNDSWSFYFQVNQPVLNLRLAKMFKSKKSRISTHWSAPSFGFVKFNVDSCSIGKLGLAGVGGVLRNEGGLVIGLFSRSIGIVDSNVAELVAICEALEMFIASDWVTSRSLIIETNSPRAVSWVCDRARVPWCGVNIYNKILSLLRSVPSVQFHHVPREANAFADGLARSGVHRHQPFYAWI